MANPQFPNSEFLIGRAVQCRSLAGGFVDPTLRDRMLALAGDYEEMAKAADALRPLENIRVSELKS